MICGWCELGSSVSRVRRLFAQTAHLMVGIPDYDTYVEHRRRSHPGEPVRRQWARVPLLLN